MNKKIIKNGFILAAMMNFSVLIFSKGFTNSVINEARPSSDVELRASHDYCMGFSLFSIGKSHIKHQMDRSSFCTRKTYLYYGMDEMDFSKRLKSCLLSGLFSRSFLQYIRV